MNDFFCYKPPRRFFKPPQRISGTEHAEPQGTFPTGSDGVRVCTHRQTARFIAMHYRMVLSQDRKGDAIMHIDVRNAGSLSVLTLPGNLSGRHAETLKIYLRRSLDQDGRLIVDCEQVSLVDPSCLTVLCAAYRISRALHKDFIVAGHRPGPF